MNKISNSNTLELIIKILTFILLAKVIMVGVWMFLPSNGVDLQNKQSYRPEFQRIDFKNMIANAPKVEQKVVTATIENSISITNMILKGLYGLNDHGFIIIALKASQNDTSIISVGETFSGYELKSILHDGALFIKDGKEYVLKMDEEKTKAIEKRVQVEEDIDDGEPKQVAKSDISYYQKHPSQIWRDIAIDEIKNGSNIDGFKIMNVRKGSKMDTLGLKKGDIIIRANNKDLRSYKDAFDIYNKINTLKSIQIVILRNNQEKEFIYEIN